MLDSLLPSCVAKVLDRYDRSKICEIRIRDGKPIVISSNGVKTLLLSDDKKPVVAEAGLSEKIIAKATEFSLYSQNNQVVKGFITAKGGVRIGLCGEVVVANGEMKTIKNCKSLNIRIPKEVIGCAEKIKKFVINKDFIHNTLVVSPPGQGKTTLLRDIARIISDMYQSVLVVDERMELSGYDGTDYHFNLGDCADVITNCDKNYAFTYAIRSMAPDVIVTDELVSVADFKAVQFACNSGVKVVASIHASSIMELKSKINKVTAFSRYVILSGRNGPGTIESIYDSDFNKI